MFQVEVFWVVTPCSVVLGYQRFWRPQNSQLNILYVQKPVSICFPVRFTCASVTSSSLFLSLVIVLCIKRSLWDTKAVNNRKTVWCHALSFVQSEFTDKYECLSVCFLHYTNFFVSVKRLDYGEVLQTIKCHGRPVYACIVLASSLCSFVCAYKALIDPVTRWIMDLLGALSFGDFRLPTFLRSLHSQFVSNI